MIGAVKRMSALAMKVRAASNITPTGVAQSDAPAKKFTSRLLLLTASLYVLACVRVALVFQDYLVMLVYSACDCLGLPKRQWLNKSARLMAN